MVKKEEGEHPISKKPKRTKEEIEEARQLKIKKKEEEEQSRWRWLEKKNAAFFILHCLDQHATHTLNTLNTNYLGKAERSNFNFLEYMF